MPADIVTGGSDPVVITMSATAFVFVLTQVAVMLKRWIDGKRNGNGKNGNSLGSKDNPHVTSDTYKTDLSKLYEKQGYHTTEIKLLKDGVERMENTAFTLDKKVDNIRDVLRDIYNAHKTHFPDDEITKVK